MTSDEMFEVANDVTKAARKVHAQETSKETAKAVVEALHGDRGARAFEAALLFFTHHTRYLKTKATLRDVFVLAKERAADSLRVDMDEGRK